MGIKSPEDELAEFLALLPSWHRKILQLDDSLSREEFLAYLQSDWLHAGGAVEDEYLELLKQCPREWREYCKRKRKLALKDVPRMRPGRRPTPQTELASLLELKKKGLNPEQIAGRLGLTKEAIRKRIKVAKKRLKP